MAISSADISALPDYTDSELLKLYKWALANGAAGTTRSINGRSVSFPSTTDILTVIREMESRVNAASSDDGRAIITFDEAS
jgi:hypothetical protein